MYRQDKNGRLIIFAAFMLFTLLNSSAQSNINKQNDKPNTFTDARTLENSVLRTWVMNNGTFARHPETNNAGLNYPKDEEKTLIYLAGIWFAGKVNGEVRTACADFNSEYQPGVILPNGKPDDPSRKSYRIYIIGPNDSADSLDAHYNRDYAEWPVADGAPTDENGNPLILGDQTLWYVANDADTALHNSAYHTNPLNLEVHVLMWMFNDDKTPLGRTIFLHYTFINKSCEHIKDSYVGIYHDPDLGDGNDDRNGCDTTISLGYTYNGRSDDSVYGDIVPAAGFCLLHGPTIDSAGNTAFQLLGQSLIDRENLNLSAYQIFISGHPLYDDLSYSNSGAKILYERMRGRDSRGMPIIDLKTGESTPFMFYGDPIHRTGWLDEHSFPYCDRRTLMSTGTFSMAPGDTQRIAFAFVVGHKRSHLISISDLKKTAWLARNFYQNRFKVKALANVKTKPTDEQEFEMAVHASIESELDVLSVNAELFTYDNQRITNIELFDDGKHNDGQSGDGDFSNIWYSKEFPQALYLNLRITDINSDEYMFEHCAEKITLIRENLVAYSLNIFDDHINFDGMINPGENTRLTFEVKNNSGFDFDMANIFIYPKGNVISSRNRHFFFNDLAAGEIDSTEYIHGDETSYYEFQAENDTTTLYFNAIIHDDTNHQWLQENWFSLSIVPLDLDHNIIIPNKISGKSEAMFKIRIINPPALKNHQYLIAVSDSVSLFNEKMFHLVDQTVKDTLLENQTPPEQFGYNIPITDGFKIIEAFLPHGGFEGMCQESANGHPCAFEDVEENGQIKKSGHIFTRITGEAFPKLIELEFVNEIDSNGVVGKPDGQSAFRMTSFPNEIPDGFFPCPFNVWQLENGQRVSLLNAGFLENDYRAVPDSQWQPGELIYIFKTLYDETGQIYLNQPFVWEDLIVEVFLSFKSGQSIIDSGDQIFLEYEYPGTSDDQFLFVPTHTKVPGTDVKMKKYEIFQNYPNPFNPSTIIYFRIAKCGRVSLKIYNIRGQLVDQLIDKNFFPGSYSVHWNGTDQFGQPVSSGVYFAKLSTGQKSSIIKMLLIR